MPDSVGDPRKRNPIPLKLRNQFIPREFGGSKGWRGAMWQKARERALKKTNGRSTISGLTYKEATLEVDHIIPYRLGGSNEQINLRITDTINNVHTDIGATFRENKPVRRLRKF